MMHLEDMLATEIFSGTASIAVAYLICVVYKYFRNHISVSVNCWFCNCNLKVPYRTRNEWTCSKCGQFNGFNKDGGYSKMIPEQYDERLNKWSFTQTKNTIPADNNGLCRICNANQELKIMQLACYVPFREEKYDEEIEAFRKKLENAYKLCPKCELVLQNNLQKKTYPFNFKPLDKKGQRNYIEMILKNWTKLMLLITGTFFSLYCVYLNYQNPISYTYAFLPYIQNYANLIYFILTIIMNLLSFRISYLEGSKAKKTIALTVLVVSAFVPFVEYIELLSNTALIKVGVLVMSFASVIYILVAPKKHPKVVYNCRFQKLPSDKKENIMPEEVREKVVPCKIRKQRFSVDTMMCNEISHLNLGYSNNIINDKKPHPFETRKFILTPSKLDVIFKDSSRESVSTDSSGYDSVYSRNVHDFDNSDFLYKYNYYASMQVPVSESVNRSDINNHNHTVVNSSIIYVWLTSLTFFILGYFVKELLSK